MKTTKPNLPPDVLASDLKYPSYDKKEKFVCRLEVNAAGVAVYIGEKGNTELCDLSWERLVEQLQKK